jgi:heat shock protein HtpX
MAIRYAALYVGSALHTLIKWYDVLHPGQIWDMSDWITGITKITANVVMFGLAQIPRLGVYLLIHLIWRDSQRAEYLADYLAATVSGPKAHLTLLDKSHMHSMVDLLVQTTALKQEQPDLFAELQGKVAQIPARERERIRRVAQLQESRLDTTHPPTAYRMAFLQSHFLDEARFILDSDDHERLEQELATLRPEIQQQLIDDYRQRLFV